MGSAADTGADIDDQGFLAPDAAAIAGLLAGDDRRRAFAALVLGASSLDEVRAATGLPARAAATALLRLVDGGLVERTGLHDHVVLGAAFRRAAMAAARARPAAAGDLGEAPTDQARVLRTYLRDGRLTHIPANRTKRRIVLDRLAQDFELGFHYSEPQVNMLLHAYHDDVASLRRYLVDEGFLDRAAGEYWRAGGSAPTTVMTPDTPDG